MSALPEAGGFLARGGQLGYLAKPFTVDVMRTTVQARARHVPRLGEHLYGGLWIALRRSCVDA